jgi:hypothetical protein
MIYKITKRRDGMYVVTKNGERVGIYTDKNQANYHIKMRKAGFSLGGW